MLATLAAIAFHQGAVSLEPPTTAYLTWPGWSYLSGAASAPSKAYIGSTDFTKFAPPVEGAATWRVKVFVLRDVLRVGKDESGMMRSDRETIPDGQFTNVELALGRFGALLGPNIKVSPEISAEEESMALPYRANPVDEAFLQRYVGARVNGGGYEADDKVYRGPYHSILVLVPAAMQPQVTRTTVYGMPVECMSIETPTTPFNAGVLEGRIADEVWNDVMFRARQRLDMALPGPYSKEDYAKLTDWTPVPGADLVRRLTSPVPLIAAVPPSAQVSAVTAWRTNGAQADIVDSDGAKIARFILRGPTKHMGASFPARSDGKPIFASGDGKTLSLRIRTLAKDSLSIRLEDSEGHRAWLALGDEPTVPGMAEAVILRSPIAAQGEWETVRVSLPQLLAKSGLKDVTQMALEFSPAARQTGRDLLEQIQVDFSEVAISNEEPTASLVTPSESEKRARIAADATETSGELRAMLSGTSRLVKLNAAMAYQRIKDAEAEPALSSLGIGADPGVAAAAIRALAFQGTDSAKALIRRLIRTAITPAARAEAVLALADTADAKLGGDFSSLLVYRSWQSRLAAVQALAKLPGREAAILRLAFLAQENPEIKLAVIRNLDASDEAQARRMLWGAVNEPLDIIRAESAIKLIASGVAELRTEGYKAVRDESPTVRALVLESMVATPSEAHREALRIGLADRNGVVRAAAIRAFAAMTGGATGEELASLAEDLDPDVQVALANYGLKHKLPAGILARLKASALPNVREVAARIND